MVSSTAPIYLASSAAESVIVAASFYCLFEYMAESVLIPENCGSWKIKRCVRTDIACKAVSAVFAAFATVCGLALITGGERRNSDKLDHILLVASGYFIYDIFAMFRCVLLCNVNEGRFKLKHSFRDIYNQFFTSYRAYEDENVNASSQKKTYTNGWCSRVVGFVDFIWDKPLMMAHHLLIALFFIPLMMNHLADHEPGDLV